MVEDGRRDRHGVGPVEAPLAAGAQRGHFGIEAQQLPSRTVSLGEPFQFIAFSAPAEPMIKDNIVSDRQELADAILSSGDDWRQESDVV